MPPSPQAAVAAAVAARSGGGFGGKKGVGGKVGEVWAKLLNLPRVVFQVGGEGRHCAGLLNPKVGETSQNRWPNNIYRYVDICLFFAGRGGIFVFWDLGVVPLRGVLNVRIVLPIPPSPIPYLPNASLANLFFVFFLFSC